MSKWRPIKTAPLDKIILLAAPQGQCGPEWTVMQGRWVDGSIPHTNQVTAYLESRARGESPPAFAAPVQCVGTNLCVSGEGHWRISWPGIMQNHGFDIECQSYEDRGCMLFRPTHWQPLPNAPRRRP